MQGLLMFKKIKIRKDQGVFVRKNLKNKHRYYKVIGSEDTLV